MIQFPLIWIDRPMQLDFAWWRICDTFSLESNSNFSKRRTRDLLIFSTRAWVSVTRRIFIPIFPSKRYSTVVTAHILVSFFSLDSSTWKIPQWYVAKRRSTQSNGLRRSANIQRRFNDPFMISVERVRCVTKWQGWFRPAPINYRSAN